jgi:hypothetical protein
LCEITLPIPARRQGGWCGQKDKVCMYVVQEEQVSAASMM